MARTMSDEQERNLRENAEQHLCLGTDDTKAILAELDAERAAHAVTKLALVSAKAEVLAETHAHEVTRQTVTEYTHNITELSAELTALNARLALAEAVCESCDVCDSFGVSGQRYDAKALAAWRAAK